MQDTRHIPSEVRQYLDIEAGEDEPGSSEEDELSIGMVVYHFRNTVITISITDGFIDNRADEGAPHAPLTWKDFCDTGREDSEGLGDDWEALLHRSHRNRPGPGDPDDQDILSSLIDEAISTPSASDYPLWRVRCRVSPIYTQKFSTLNKVLNSSG